MILIDFLNFYYVHVCFSTLYHTCSMNSNCINDITSIVQVHAQYIHFSISEHLKSCYEKVI